MWSRLRFEGLELSEVNRTLRRIVPYLCGSNGQEQMKEEEEEEAQDEEVEEDQDQEKQDHAQEQVLQELSFVGCSAYTVEDPPRSSESIHEQQWSREQLEFLRWFERVVRWNSRRFHSLRLWNSYGLSVLITRIVWTLTTYSAQRMEHLLYQYQEDFINEDRTSSLLQ